jgi:hypothetical protein
MFINILRRHAIWANEQGNTNGKNLSAIVKLLWSGFITFNILLVSLFNMAPQSNSNPYQNSVQSEMVNVVSRLRLLEERHTNLQRKMHLIEEHYLSSAKEYKTEMKVMQSELLEMKRSVHEFAEVLERLTKSLEDFATREDVRLIDKYVSLLDPTNFISRAQLEGEVRRQIETALLKRDRKKDTF